MALTGCDGSNFMRRNSNDLSPTHASNLPMGFGIYFKNTGAPGGTTGIVGWRSADSGTNAGLSFVVDTSNRPIFQVRPGDSATVISLTGSAMTANTWYWLFGYSEGFNGQSGNAIATLWQGGAQVARTTTATYGNSSSAALDNIRVGHSMGAAGVTTQKHAHVLTKAVADETDAATLGTSLADPATFTGLLWSYPLIADGVRATGSVNLTAFGSPTFDADAPTFGGSGGGNVIVASGWCEHRESARDHARRLSIGWSRAMDLRRAA